MLRFEKGRPSAVYSDKRESLFLVILYYLQPESLLLVIPDIVNGESLWGFYRWIPATDTQV